MPANALRRAAWIGLALVLGLPILLAGLAVLPRFDGLYGQDPYAYYDYASGPLRAALLALRLPPPFTWPPGYPLLTALASLPLGATPRAGQGVSLLAGALVPAFTALLAFEVWGRKQEAEDRRGRTPEGQRGNWAERQRAEDRRSTSPLPGYVLRVTPYGVPLLAGLLVALTGQLWQSSIVVMADTTGLAAATAGVWTLARFGRDDPGRPAAAWLLLAAAAMAFAVLTRWAYALVAIPATAYALLVLSKQGWRRAVRLGVAAALVVVAVLSAMWLPALRVSAAGEPAPFAVDLAVYSWNPFNALRRQFVTADGLLSYAWPNGLWYALAPAHRFYFTALLAPLLIPGLWSVARRRAAAPIFLLLGWAGVIFLFHAGAPWQNFRFNLAHLPPLAILVAIGVETIGLRLVAAGRRPGLRRLALVALVATVLAGMALMARGGWALTRGFVAHKNADLALVQAVEARVPPSAQVIAFGITLTLQHYSHLPTYEIYFLDEPALKQLAGSARPLYVLLDLPNVQSQWHGRSPELAYRWLRQHTFLEKVGEFGPYTLLEVQPEP